MTYEEYVRAIKERKALKDTEKAVKDYEKLNLDEMRAQFRSKSAKITKKQLKHNKSGFFASDYDKLGSISEEVRTPTGRRLRGVIPKASEPSDPISRQKYFNGYTIRAKGDPISITDPNRAFRNKKTRERIASIIDEKLDIPLDSYEEEDDMDHDLWVEENDF